ncbi:MAG: phosphatidate cytidylyltransferase [Nitratireductor sp.]|nr:phosphatidate cytidylyltransferase [Nitratireductor sp.]
MSELALRVASALVMLAVVLGMTFAGGYWFAAFCAIAVFLVATEFSSLTRLSLPKGFTTAILAFVAATVAAWFVAGPAVSFQVLLAGLALLALSQLFVHRKLWAAACLAYSVLPFLALCLLRGDSEKGLHAVLFVFACVFAADTFAYFAGRAIGGPKLAPRVSPNKTWAGFFGGLAGSVAVGVLLLVIIGYRPGLTAVEFALAISLVSQMGDLFESWVKRRFGKKDSGAMIPGHGGLLDRIDGLIFACVAAWVAAILAGGEAFLPGATGAALMDAMVAP